MGNATSASQATATGQVQAQEALDALLNGEQYVQEIRKLEADHQAKLSKLTGLQQALREAQHEHSATSQRLVEYNNRRRAEHMAMLEARNKEKVRSVGYYLSMRPGPHPHPNPTLKSHSAHRVQEGA